MTDASVPLDRQVSSADAEHRASRRYTRTFLATLVMGLVFTAAFAWFTDPLHTFGSGHVGSFLTVEFDSKPEAFQRADPPPQAIVVGASRVMKLNPACITELTGYSAFNFALTSSRAEDWSAAYRFVRARGKLPLRELIIGVDPDGFDNHADTEPRLLSSRYLRSFLDDSWQMSWGVVARALFGWQAFKYGALLLWYQVHPSSRPNPKMSFDDRGFATYNTLEREVPGRVERGVAFEKMAARLRGELSGRGFDALSPRRVALFLDMVRSAHAAGARVDVFIPPLPPEISALRAAPMLARARDLETLLDQLEREGTLHVLRIHRLEDFHGDPEGYYDGLHMTEDNSTRVLLALFQREHGCGQ